MARADAEVSEFVTPPALERGDRVAIVSPGAGHAHKYPHVYELGLERIREDFDLEPVEFPTACATDEYLRDHPEERARDVMDAFRDPEIGGVIATIGGHDQVRILPYLEPDVLRNHPTRFYGTSDNTNLACYLWNLGIVSFYGGNVMTEFAAAGSMHEHTVEHLERALFADAIGAIRPADEFTDEDLDWGDPSNLEREPETESSQGWRWHGGAERVEGRTWGGCLEIVDLQLSVDRYLPPTDELEGCVLALETSELLPEPWYVRQVLLGMGERGLLKRFDAVLIGRAKARSVGDERAPDERRAYRERQREAMLDVIPDYNPDAPIVFDVEFGHTRPVVPVPIGGRVIVDPAEERIAFP